MKATKVKRKRNLDCVFCNKSFSCYSNHSKHILSHIKEKPHFCKICGASFCQKVQLNAHLIGRHGNSDIIKTEIECENKKQYKCSLVAQCDKVFASKYALNIHQRRHTANKDLAAFKCDLCPATFGLSEDLQKHRKRHDKAELNVTCDVSDEAMLWSMLGTHRLQCHPEDCYRDDTNRVVRRRRNRIRTRNNRKGHGSRRRGQSQSHDDADEGINDDATIEEVKDESGGSRVGIACHICGNEFENDTELFQHRKDHLDLDVKDDDADELNINQIKYKCLFCPGVFKGMELLESHFVEVHKGNVDLNSDLEEKENESINSIPKRRKKKRRRLEMNADPGTVNNVMEEESSRKTQFDSVFDEKQEEFNEERVSSVNSGKQRKRKRS